MSRLQLNRELNITLAVLLATLDAFALPDCNIAPSLSCEPKFVTPHWITVNVKYHHRGYINSYGYNTWFELLREH